MNTQDQSVDSMKAALNDNSISVLEKREILRKLILAAKSKPAAFPMSFSQQSLWIRDRILGPNATYNTKYGLMLEGCLDLALLERCFEYLAQRQGSLRTSFGENDGVLVQWVHPKVTLSCPVVDLSGLAGTDGAAVAKTLMAEGAGRVFYLDKLPLFRLALFRFGKDHHGMLLVMHHSISDGISMSIFVSELISIYTAFAQGREPELAELTTSYAAYAQEQERAFAANEYDGTLDTLVARLDGAPQLIDLPLKAARPAVQRFHGDRVSFTVPAPLLEATRQLAQRSGATLFMTLSAVYAAMLSRYTGQRDLVIGTPVANRVRAQYHTLIGFFANMVALRFDLEDNPSGEALLRRTRSLARDLFAHQHIPFGVLVNQLKIPRSNAFQPLVQVAFTLYNIQVDELQLPGVVVEKLPLTIPTAMFDLDLVLTDLGDSLSGVLEYNTDILERGLVEAMGRHFVSLLDGFVRQPNRPLADLELLGTEERAQILQLALGADPETGLSEISLSGLFERRAARSPESVALHFEGTELTYGELDRRANQLAFALRACGVTAEVPVAVALERSPAVVLAMLAIFKAGGVYLPLDPNLPSSRLTFMCQDSGAQRLITDHATQDQLALKLDHIVYLDETPGADALNQRVAGTVLGNQLAYVIYTSGSTGLPKGVAVSHGSIAAHCQQLGDVYQLSADDRCYLFFSFNSDASVADAFAAFHAGARLVVSPRALILPQELDRVIEQLGINVLHLPPAYFQEWVGLTRSVSALPSLRIVCVGSDVLPAKAVSVWQNTALCLTKRALLHNCYGPTEATVQTTIQALLAPLDGSSVPIGRPLPGRSLYVLDRCLTATPRGVAGEMCIGGLGLARGYLNRSRLTAEKFVPHPFATKAGERLYRTGDLGSYLADGALSFHGRVDHQVKLRGFRIELGEVENVLARHPGLDQVLVLAAAKAEDARLIAYVIPRAGAVDPDPAHLRDHLGASLPDYMVPSQFVTLASFPVTRNGKIDRQELLTLAQAAQTTRVAARVAPVTALEQQLTQIWSELLQLDPNQISTQASFFELGGHSLLATRLVATIRKDFGVELPLQDVFAAASLADLAQRLTLASGFSVAGPVARDPSVPLALSFAQERLWFLYQLEGPSPTYSLPLAHSIRGGLDVAALTRAFQALIDRHEILRTHIGLLGEEPVQTISAQLELKLNLVDLTGMMPETAQELAQRLCQAEAARPFRLEQSPLIRVMLIQCGPQYVLHLNQHHIISDGWSIGILIREVLELYRLACGAQATIQLKPLALQYGDYSVWQKQLFSGDFLQGQLDFWKRELADAPFTLELPTKGTRPAQQTFAGQAVSFQLSAALTRGLNALAQAQGLTLFMVLESVFAELLGRYSGAREVLVGTPIANRRYSELEPLIGLFVNTLVLRNRLDRHETVAARFAALRQTALAAFDHQDIPFERLVEALNPSRDQSRSPLFQVMFVLQNNDTGRLEAEQVVFEPFPQTHVVAKFDLNLIIVAEEEGLSAGLEFNTDLFEPKTAQTLSQHWQNLLTQVVANPTQAMSSLPMLSAAERDEILVQWNATARPVPGSRVLHHAFEARAAAAGDRLAVLFEDQTLTYSEVNEQANRLAHLLATKGCGRGSLVAVFLDRSAEMVPALLAILKCGAAYVPIETQLPDARVIQLLCALETQTVLSQTRHLPFFQQHADQLPALNVLVCLDGEPSSVPQLEVLGAVELASQPGQNLGRAVEPIDLAYIIFTSGSTGEPKGVVISHEPVTNLIAWVNRTHAVAPSDRVLFVTALSFDLSVYDVFGLLSAGGSIRVASGSDTRDPLRLINYLYAEPITFWDSAPVALQQLAPFLEPNRSGNHHLRLVFLSGDWVPLSLPPLIQSCFPNAEVVALGGATEATIWSNYFPVTSIEPEWASVPYGYPIQNAAYYSLDPSLQPTPKRVTGDLFIGGEVLFLGYWNARSLTAWKLIPDPYSQKPGGRLYRTGDLARWWEQGYLEFMGRADHQVKIRGFRVECGEIEAVILDHAALATAVVRPRDLGPNDRRLIAYLVPTAGQSIDLEGLRETLKQKLPVYMVPSLFLVLEQLPVTANGKLDTKALAALPLEPGETNTPYLPPVTEVEQKLAQIWRNLLSQDRIGLADNFFDLGGQSLLATRMVAQIRETFRVELPLKTLFSAPTIRDLALALAELAASDAISGPRAQTRSADAPLSFPQSRLWFLDQLSGPSATYNLPLALKLEGVLDLGALEAGFQSLFARHESLRTHFGEINGRPSQIVTPEFGFLLHCLDLTGLLDAEARAAQLALDDSTRSFNLRKLPLIRITLIRFAATDHLLLLNQHHIISDGWSAGRLIDEIVALYTGTVLGNQRALPPLALQYADYAIWQRDLLQGPELERQRRYWVGQLGDPAEPLRLPSRGPRPVIQTYTGAVFNFRLAKTLSHQVGQLAQAQQATVFMVLQAVFAELMGRYSGQDDFTVGTPIANRRYADLEPVLGFFVNTLVLRNRRGRERVRDRISAVRQMVLAAFDHQDLPFEQLVEALNPVRDTSRSPLFEVLFALQNMDMGQLKAPGLKFTPVEQSKITALYDLALHLQEDEAGLNGALTYNTDLLEPGLVQAMASHFQTLVAQFCAQPEAVVAELDMLSEVERDQLLHSWNAPTGRVWPVASIHEAFALQVAQQPDAIAVYQAETSLTYAELDSASNRLAQLLLLYGCMTETRVAFALDRSPQMMVTLLAILKAGGVYVPLDPSYPQERLALMLEDSFATIIVTEMLHEHVLPSLFQVQYVILDDEDLNAYADLTPALPIERAQLAYLNYTSGTTGQPKAVQITHGNVLRLVGDTTYVDLAPGACVGQVSNASFDALTFEVWTALLGGGKLCIVPRETLLDIPRFAALIRAESIKAMFLTVTFFNECVRHDPTMFETMDYLLYGGERASAEHVRSVFAAGPPKHLINGYGPTETTTFALTYEATDPKTLQWQVPIGNPIADTQLYAVCPELHLQAILAPGELMIAGEGLARGYLNQPGLTAQRFLPNPFASADRPGSRMYRSGDLVQREHSGVVVYLGRIGNQVKIRGYRIEPDEITAVLKRYYRVEDAVVLVDEAASGKRLVAAFTLKDNDPGFKTQDLRDFLSPILPDYMMPGLLLQLEVLPRTPNGKANHRAILETARRTGSEDVSRHQAPQTATELQLQAIWAELLDVATAKVGSESNFFELGGHSLLATRLVSNIRSTFLVELPLQEVFSANSMGELAAQISSQLGQAEVVAGPRPADRSLPLPLSYAQQRLWFLYQLEGPSPTYNMPFPLRMLGWLDSASLERSFQALIARHELLRTHFEVHQDQMVQVIEPRRNFDLTLIDLSHLEPQFGEVLARRLLESDAQKPFQMEQGRLLRANLVRLSETKQVLLLNQHHIISDGWSIGVMVREVIAGYQPTLTQRSPDLAALPIQYADYAVWQKQLLEGPLLELQLAYWQTALAGAPLALDLPTRGPRPAMQTFNGQLNHFAIEAGLTRRVKALSISSGSTPFMVLGTVFGELLGRYGDCFDVLVGTPIANRRFSELEPLIGFFVNTLVLRYKLDPTLSSRAHLAQAQTMVLDAFAHQDIPFERLVEVINPVRDLSRSPLFQVMFSFENSDLGTLASPGLVIEGLNQENQIAKFDLSLSLSEQGDTWIGTLDSNADLFEFDLIQRLAGHFQNLLQGFLDQPELPVGQLAMVSEAERHQLVTLWNQTETHFDRSRSLWERFEQVVSRTPEALAILLPAVGQRSYAELAADSLKIASRLRAMGCGRETRVGLALTRETNLVAALLAVLHTGSAYVPLEVGLPEGRVHYFIADSGCEVVLTTRAVAQALQLEKTGRPLVCLDEAMDEPVVVQAAALIDPQQAVYVIYTSGSTGLPKGVVVPYQGLTEKILDMEQRLTLSPGYRHLVTSAIGFDPLAGQLLLPLVLGGCAVLVANPTGLEPQAFWDLIEETRADVIDLVPSVLAHFLVEPPSKALKHRPAYLLLGGEALTSDLLQRVTRCEYFQVIANTYGPTEATIDALYYDTAQHDGTGPIPIGKPMANYGAYLLDRCLNPVPVGVQGDLYLGGIGLARGYFNRPGLTAEKFVPNPFGEAGTRLYLTGDLVVQRADGEMVFLGRRDHQLKLRGVRVELGEIEAVLCQFEAVSAAVVLADPNRANRLVAILVPNVSALKGTRQDAASLSAALRQLLPAALIPADFLFQDQLPLTPNGKLDRQALLRLIAAVGPSQEVLSAPQSTTEWALARIWSQLLAVPQDQVGRQSNFFALGGHSLLATRLVAAIRKSFQIELPLREIFADPCLQALAQRIAAQKGGTVVQGPVPVQRDKPLPLSFAQQRLWFLHLLDGPSPAYHMPMSLRLEGEALDLDALQRSFQALVRRHEVLRTRFVTIAEQTYQVIDPVSHFELSIHDLRSLSRDEAEAQVAALLADDFATPFVLETGPLLRALVLQIGERESVLHINMHHIISDGWSMGILTQELVRTYSACRDGQNENLDPLVIQYGDYAVWQSELLEGAVLEKQLQYWTDALANAPTALELPTRAGRPAIQTNTGARVPVALDKALCQGIKRLESATETTLFMVLESVFAEVLARTSGVSDLLIGTPIANRRFSELEPVIGFFVNTLVLRHQLSPAETVRERLTRAREMALEAFAHQDLPFERLVEALNPARDLSRSPLFQVMFILQNNPVTTLSQSGLALTPIESDQILSKFDLTLSLEETSEGLSGAMVYNPDLFEARMIEAMVGHFVRLLEVWVAQPDQRVDASSMLSEAERQFLVHELNTSQPALDHEPALYSGFFRQAQQAPEQIALVYQDQRWNYAALVAKVGQLGLALQRAGVGPEHRVGILLERRPELLCSMLAVLAVGATYVPLDPAYPQERLAFMLEDAGTSLLISSHECLVVSGLKPSCPSLYLEDLTTTQKTFVPQPVWPGQLAYLIYTSGSTGKPKAVAISHFAATRFLAWAGTVYSPADLSGVLAATSVCFDLSIFELFLPATVGGTIYLVKDILALETFADAESLSLINTVPSAAAELVNQGWLPPNLQVINLAGEPLSTKLVDALYQWPSLERVYDLYGPSEDTTYSTYRLRSAGGPATIGRPISGTRAYLLDPRAALVVLGSSGELVLAGDGLARGYLGQPGQTAARFVPDPYSGEAGGRMYRSGDLAAYFPDGNLQLLGRIDHQVKLRGFRIELAEIERQLESVDQVQQAVVLVAEVANDPRLVAHIKTEALDLVPALQAHLAAQLPAYMIPSQYVLLAEFPSLPNGKVDRRALQRFSRDGAGSSQTPTNPQNATEAQLLDLFATLLGLKPEQIGTQTSFFDLGGHSLLATRLVAAIRQSLNVEVAIRDIFVAPSVQALSLRVAASRSAAVGGPVAVDRDRLLPLSFAQQRLWFLYQLEGMSVNYNMPLTLQLKGEPIDLTALQQSFAALVARHESLRTRFVTEAGQTYQQVQPAHGFNLIIHDLQAVPAEFIQAETTQIIGLDLATPFKLESDQLLRALAIVLEPEEIVLHINMHHIVSDGWSMNLLSQELVALYLAFRNGQPSPFPPLAIQYGDYAVWQQRLLEGDVLQDQLHHWIKALDDAPTVLELPNRGPRPAIQTFNGAVETFRIGAGLVQQLEQRTRATGTTPFMLLQAVFAELLARYSGARDLLLGTPIANRRFSELEPLIGFFVNTLVLRNQLVASDSIASRLARVREMALEAFAHQDLPFERLVEAMNPERDLSRSPLFQVMFLLQNNANEQNTESKLSLTPIEADQVLSKFDLTLSLSQTPEGFSGNFEFNTDLFEPSAIQTMAGHYLRLLEGFVGQTDHPVAMLPMLSDGELQFLLHELNRSAEQLNPEPFLASSFFRQAQTEPETIALVHEGRSVSYAQLVQRASRLAAVFQRSGVTSEDRVGILLERDPELVASLLATLAVGAAYVPLDPAYPNERLSYMLGDAGCSLLVSHREVVATSGLKPTCATLYLDCLEADETAFAPVVIEPTQLAYLIYTSGSTGNPKAVAISHFAATRFLAWAGTVYSPADLSGVLAATSVCFDLSIFEMFLPASVGGTIYLVKDILAVAELAEVETITLINTVPSAAAELLQQGWLPPKLRVINLAGEPLSASLVDDLYQHRTLERVYDLYGPSEDTTYSTYSLRVAGGPATIGRPIAGTTVFLLNQQGFPVVLGGFGELVLGGDGLARGYLGQPGQTAARFVPDPFSGVAGGRLYRSGDLAAYLPDGNLRLLGRIDHQVKLRGFRIELGEIERQLESFEQVEQALVMVSSVADDRRLLAFVKTASTEMGSELRAALSERLPAYMVPNQLFLLNTFPSLPNGKVDRKALLSTAVDFPADLTPGTEREQQVAALFARCLGREVASIGVQTSFFELGGHSLLMVRLASLLEQRFSIKLPVVALFKDPSVRGIAALLERREIRAHESLVHLNDQTEGQPWFVIHPIGGQVHWFLPIAQALGNVPVYGLEAPGLSQGQPTNQLDLLVAQYLESMMTVQPRGPFRLLAWSAGGTIALAMAQALERRGFGPVDVVLIDAFQLPEPGFEVERDQALAFLADLAYGRSHLAADLVLKACADCQTATQVWARLDKAGFLPEGWTQTYLDRLFQVFRATRQAVGGYQATTHEGRTLLIRAEEGAAQDHGWLDLEGLTVTTVPGHHYSLLEQPHLAAVVEAIEVFVNRLSGANP